MDIYRGQHHHIFVFHKDIHKFPMQVTKLQVKGLYVICLSLVAWVLSVSKLTIERGGAQNYEIQEINNGPTRTKGRGFQT